MNTVSVHQYLKDAWKILLLRGILLIVFGLFAIVWPEMTLGLIVLFFAIYLLIDGVLNMIGGIRGAGKISMWFLVVILSVLQIVVGVYMLKNPAVSVKIVVALIGIVLLVKGLFELIGAFDKSYSSTMKVLMMILGVVTMIIGAVLILNPVTTGLVFVWLLGAYALIAGPISIGLALDVKSVIEEEEK